ncbi:MAG: MFS transporter [Pseudomonadales bacterium]|nr:MFS transporter [Pseudomonadales bacterium]
MKKQKQNITLMYLITAFDYSWFWAAIWVLFYLRYTNYAGIGLLESVMIITSVVGEIPTGAIADLLGKKKTLMLSFLFGFLGNMLMGLANSFFILASGVMVATIGGVLSSGTNEALIYDSLLTNKEESKYEKVLGNISSIKMLTLAIASIIGGFMYKMNPGLPFIALAIMKLLALIVSFWLSEPPIDSYVFSWQNYIKQTKEGIRELFKTNEFPRGRASGVSRGMSPVS